MGIALTRNGGNVFGWDHICSRNQFYLVGEHQDPQYSVYIRRCDCGYALTIHRESNEKSIRYCTIIRLYPLITFCHTLSLIHSLINVLPLGVPATFGTVLKASGEVLGGVRNALEAGDTFVGRYLVICTTVYVTFKLAHYKLFNDLIPF